ncbi:hypothetical protein N7492_004747 [Penicillium capsulatum]|uniref:Major facilitator superfamily (MFS) profile domain-containing protein n=1 Tax=Penicillium capsulatum TaxID=69766 RepID=A0A9W9I888_9EURO|nr:hypothetical protein N7492_004747 [Penicillium capsulatum]KAJ6136147.1 hypothetical protein N7512_001307 [Penicillium capsulatum]
MSHPKSNQDDFVESTEDDPAKSATQGDFGKQDGALNLLEDVGHSTILTPENNKTTLRKIDLRLLPILLSIYFLQQLDKSTLSYASVFGLIEDANLHGQMYSWLGSVIYLAQLVFQPLVSYLLVKVPLGKFLAASTLLWGIALTCMTPADNFGKLLVCRIFLGVFEAGIGEFCDLLTMMHILTMYWTAPAFIAVTQMWYRRMEQPVRLGSWYAMNGVVNMFGSLITYGLGHIKSSIFAPYQIIFLFFGLITVATSAAVLIFMPDSPVSAKFLPEKDKLQGVENHDWKWDHVKEAFFDLKSWGWFSLTIATSIPSGGITTFGPLIVKSFGFNDLNTILLNIPFGAVQLIATMGGAWLATAWKMKGPVLALLCLPPIAGCVILLQIPHDESHKGPLLAGYYIISVYPAITPLIYSWSASNTAGETKKKVVTGIMYAGQCVGNVIGPNLYTTEEAPLYRRGLLSNLALFCVLVVLNLVIMAYLLFLNKNHEQWRAAAGKNSRVIDHSMLAVGSAPVDKETTMPQVASDHAFRDVTDRKNEDFVFVY